MRKASIISIVLVGFFLAWHGTTNAATPSMEDLQQEIRQLRESMERVEAMLSEQNDTSTEQETSDSMGTKEAENEGQTTTDQEMTPQLEAMDSSAESTEDPMAPAEPKSMDDPMESVMEEGDSPLEGSKDAMDVEVGSMDSVDMKTSPTEASSMSTMTNSSSMTEGSSNGMSGMDMGGSSGVSVDYSSSSSNELRNFFDNMVIVFKMIVMLLVLILIVSLIAYFISLAKEKRGARTEKEGASSKVTKSKEMTKDNTTDPPESGRNASESSIPAKKQSGISKDSSS